MLNLLMNEFGAKSFSVCLMNSVKGFVHKNLTDGVSLHYVVPENLCRKHIVKDVSRQPQVSAAAIMALFDEISTYSCGMQDRKHRPGVSVHLETEMIKNVLAGEEVVILTNTDKIGKSLAYCTMELLDTKGELLARGKHIKFLPMGAHYELITHPFILPWTLGFYELSQKKKAVPQALEEHFVGPAKHPKGFPAIDGLGKVFDILGLKRLPPATVSTDEITRAYSQIVCSNNGRIEPNSVTSYSMTVQQITMNPLGKMHGGAVGCAVEHACLLSRSGNTNEHGNQEGTEGVYDVNCYVQALDVRYISPMKGDLIVTTAEDTHAPLLYAGIESSAKLPEHAVLWRSQSIGKVLNKDDGSVCAEYTCTWAVHKQ